MQLTPRKQLLSDFLEEVWNQGRLDAIGKYLAQRYRIYHDPGDRWHGQELDVAGFTERVRISRAPIPDQRFDVQHLVEEATSVVATWRWSGTHKGEVAGFPPTGKTLTMSGITLYYFDDKRICGHWQVVDRLAIFQQLQANRE
jgi:steroid delta-isomerase-like uncharacterized protein